jgi:hypothetical protein
MSIRRRLFLAWMVAGLQTLSVGQSNTPVATPAQTPVDNSTARTAPAPAVSGLAGMQADVATEDSSSSLPQIPSLLGGVGISPAFLSEMERSNYLRGGVNVGATYDDNPLMLPNGGVGNLSGSIFPNVRIEESTSRLRWMLGYAGGLTINQRFTEQNQGSHSLIFDSQYRLSPHVNLRVAENFSITTGFFDAGTGTDLVASAGGPNTSLITPLATERMNSTTVEMNYHFALNDLIGGSGAFNDTHFSNSATGTPLPLTNTQSESGSAFWLHRLVGPNWGGVSYRFDRISFDGGETRAHSFFAVDTMNLSKRVTLTGFIGPQYIENQGVAPGGTQPAPNAWSVAGGAEAGWRDEHTSVSGGYSRTISDGGGLFGAVRLENVHGSLRQQLTPGWAAAVNAGYGRNEALTVPPSSIHVTSVGFTLERNVGKSLGLRMGYAHDFQQQFGVPGPTPASPLETFDASRNRVFVTLSYQWAKPLGM